MMPADPWFRPVDLTVGPDGSLYIADFYNAVIGHYEVPLDHPRRDRRRGRIWRISFLGGDARRDQSPAASAANRPRPLSELTLRQLLEDASAELGDRPRQAIDEVVARFGVPAAAACRQTLRQSPAPDARIAGLWCLFRLGVLQAADLAAAARDGDERVRAHAQGVAAVLAPGDPAATPAIARGLEDERPRVRRAAVQAAVRGIPWRRGPLGWWRSIERPIRPTCICDMPCGSPCASSSEIGRASPRCFPRCANRRRFVWSPTSAWRSTILEPRTLSRGGSSCWPTIA